MDEARPGEEPPIHPETRIGHVHLKVADLERAIAFYRDALGFALMQRYGNQAAFLSAGGTTITLASIRGRVGAGARRRRGRPGSTTWRSCTRPGGSWHAPSSACSTMACRSAAQATTG